MTRGYLSLRFNEASPSHHLYVNTGGRTDGNYWVAYTLHCGGHDVGRLWLRGDALDGNWYEGDVLGEYMENWLCPAILRLKFWL